MITKPRRRDLDQDNAVAAPERVIVVSAGPGSGKTDTLTRRTRRQLDAYAGSGALMLTFTNKAANEMRARVGNDSARIYGSTFHGLGTRLLSRHAGVLDMDPHFVVIDDDHRDFLAVLVGQRDPDRFPEPLKLAQQWAYRRLRDLTIHEGGELAEFGEQFEAIKRAERLMDYDDLVVYGAQILQRCEDVAKAYGEGRHLLVDELQDVNVMQAAMVRALEPHVLTISLFGDDDQSIMSFTGSDPDDVDRLVEDLGAVRYELFTNHRSDWRIIAAGNRVIDRARDTTGRAMEKAEDAAEGTLEVRHWATAGEQADALADEIAGLPDPNQVAILARNRAVADLVVEALRARPVPVPVTDWRPSRLVPMARRLSRIFLEVARTPEGDTISSYAAGWVTTLAGGNKMIDERRPDAFLAIYAGAPVADALIEMRRTLAAPDAPPAAAVDGLKAVFAAYALPDRDGLIEWFYTRAKTALDDAPRLLDDLNDLIRDDPGLTIGDLGEWLDIVPRPTMDGGGVKVGTIQATKGLEWPIVYLLGLEQGRLPDEHVLGEGEDNPDGGSLEEERRICFVGVTRAEHRLVVGHVDRYFDFRFGVERVCEASEFLDQIRDPEPEPEFEPEPWD